MAKFDFTRANQSAVATSALGADTGRLLKKKYGVKAEGIGAGVGAVTGFLAGGLQGGVDPNLGKGIYDKAYDIVRQDTLKNARSTANEAGGQIQESFARRGITGSAAAAVEGATKGKILSNAENSLVPFRSQIEMAGAQDKLGAERLNEYEDRRGWGDTLLALGGYARKTAGAIAGEHETAMASMVPMGFHGWDAERQKMFLVDRMGARLPSDWDDKTNEDKKYYLENIMGLSEDDQERPISDYTAGGLSSSIPGEQTDLTGILGGGTPTTDTSKSGSPEARETLSDFLNRTNKEFPLLPESNLGNPQSMIDDSGKFIGENSAATLQRTVDHFTGQGGQSGPQSEAIQKTSYQMQETLPQQTKENLKEARQTPPTMAEKERMQMAAPKSYSTIMDNPNSMIAKAIGEYPHAWAPIISAISELGDEQAAKLLYAYNNV